MANSPQAIKRAKQNKKRALRNRIHRSRMRTAVKNLLKNIKQTEGEKQSKPDLSKVITLIDKTVTKGVIHRNTASRLKSRLNKKVKLATTA